MNKQKYATVSELIEMFKKLEEDGLGDYVVGCNEEYDFAINNEIPVIKHDRKTVDFGGYC